MALISIIYAMVVTIMALMIMMMMIMAMIMTFNQAWSGVAHLLSPPLSIISSRSPYS